MEKRRAQGVLTLPVDIRDHTQGDPNAAITLLEYGDYECPYCGKAYSVIKQLQDKMGKRLLFAFRNFPLTDMHPNAELAAEAAEAAGKQGKFWEMHDALYENQDELGEPLIIRISKQIGLDVDELLADLRARAFKARVREDFMTGVRSGVSGTPGFFINGVKFNRQWDFDTLLNELERVEQLTSTKQHRLSG